MININGRNYNEQYIHFKGHPTPECFIYIWQTSKTVEDHSRRMTEIRDWYLAQKPERDARYHAWCYSDPAARARRLRKRGVPLKELPTECWDTLANFARQLAET